MAETPRRQSPTTLRQQTKFRGQFLRRRGAPLRKPRTRRRAAAAPAAPEVNGRGGLDPARYGDWEVKGIAADF